MVDGVRGAGACSPCGYVHCAPPSSALATPQPASASADTDPLRPFTTQRPHWTACHHPELDRAGARCATIRVPLDYRKPGGRTLTLGFSRIKATDTAHRIGLMMHNSGGPGGTSLDMPLLDAPALGKELAAPYGP